MSPNILQEICTLGVMIMDMDYIMYTQQGTDAGYVMYSRDIYCYRCHVQIQQYIHIKKYCYSSPVASFVNNKSPMISNGPEAQKCKQSFPPGCASGRNARGYMSR